MRKVKEKEKTEVVKIRKRSGRYMRTKGNAYEQQIARELRELGFEGIKTSRNESKSADDNKIDLIDTTGKLPLGIQLKKTKVTPSYFQIRKSSTCNDDDFCIIWNKQVNGKVNMKSEGECVIISKELFYRLITNYFLKQN